MCLRDEKKQIFHVLYIVITLQLESFFHSLGKLIFDHCKTSYSIIIDANEKRALQCIEEKQWNITVLSSFLLGPHIFLSHFFWPNLDIIDFFEYLKTEVKTENRSV